MSNDTIPVKTCIRCSQDKLASTDNFIRDKSRKDGWFPICKDCYRVEKRDWYYSNRERVSAQQRDYYQNNREKKLDYQRRYRENNPEKCNEWAKNNPEKKLIQNHRRDARKRGLPDTFTPNQWYRVLDYFHGCCAVCEHPLRDLFGSIVPNIDHWIPLNNPGCPGTIADNIVPLCSACNLSKSASLPQEWLERKYGKRKAKQILGRVEKYFDWVRNQQ